MAVTQDITMSVMIVGDGSFEENQLCVWLRFCGNEVHQLGFKNSREKAVLIEPEMILVNLSNVEGRHHDWKRFAPSPSSYQQFTK